MSIIHKSSGPLWNTASQLIVIVSDLDTPKGAIADLIRGNTGINLDLTGLDWGQYRLWTHPASGRTFVVITAYEAGRTDSHLEFALSSFNSSGVVAVDLSNILEYFPGISYQEILDVIEAINHTSHIVELFGIA